MKKTMSCILALLTLAAPARAQEAAPAPSPPPTEVPRTGKTGYFRHSLLFSPVEVALIQRAMQGTVSGQQALSAAVPTQIPARRVISVAGVAYHGADDWVVWINGHKVSPGNFGDLTETLIDISVDKEKVRLKWFDIGLNDVIAITMRPHQTYDIVTGVLLPG